MNDKEINIIDNGIKIILGEQEDVAKLVSKLVTTLGNLEGIKKSGYNDYLKYEYSTEEDILDEIRPKLANNGVFTFTNINDWEVKDVGKGKHLARLELQCTFACSDTGAMVAVKFVGEGVDNGDKAFYKAYTGALKYLLSKNFMLSAGNDDAEQDSPKRYTNASQRKSNKPNTQSSNKNNSTDNDALSLVRKYYRQNQNEVEDVAYEYLENNGKDKDISLLSELDEDTLEELADEARKTINKAS